MSSETTAPGDNQHQQRRGARRRRRSLRRPLRRVLRNSRWPVTAVVALGALALGYYGYGRVPGYRSGLDRLYASLSLFRFSTAAPPPYPWELEVARILALATAAYAFFRAGAAIFNEQLTRWRVRLFARNHVIVCGLGRLGSRLAKSFHDEGFVVVAIDSAPTEAELAYCREHRIRVVRGDAKDEEVLALARVDRAGYLMAVCGDDSLNSEVAALARALPRGRVRLGCFVNVSDEALCRLLSEAELDRDDDQAVTLSYFNIYVEGPRAVFRAYTLDDEDEQPPHVIVAGSGAIRGNLVLEACRRWVLTRRTWDRRLRVTMLSPEAETECKMLLEHDPRLDDVCELAPWPADPVDTGVTPLSSLIEDGAPSRVIAFVHEDDDSASLRASLLVRKALPREVRVVACTAMRSGVAQLLKGSDHDVLPNVDNFSLLDRACVSGIVLNGWTELVAESIHTNYVNRIQQRDPQAESQALAPWDLLAVNYKQSNREQAKDIERKLRAAGYDIELATWAEPPLVSFSTEEVERLAHMEHERWMSERLRGGWRNNARRDNKQELHPEPRPWEELSEEERQKNRDAMRDIPDLLARAGLVVVRRDLGSADSRHVEDGAFTDGQV